MADNKSSICSSLSFKNDKSLNRLLCAWAIQGAFGLNFINVQNDIYLFKATSYK